MKNYNYKSFMVKVYKIITRALKEGKGVGQVSRELRGLVNSYFDINKNEKYELFSVSLDLFKRCRGNNWQAKLGLLSNYDVVLGAARMVNRKKSLRQNKKYYRAMLKDNQFIFYYCTQLADSRPEHEPYQGKIYVDRFWRMKVSGKDYYAVFSYIKNHKVVTVQEITGDPVYLCNTPNCRHQFIPVSTDEVLHSSVNSIAKKRRLKHYTFFDYYSLREKVFSEVYAIDGHISFKRNVDRSRKKKEDWS